MRRTPQACRRSTRSSLVVRLIDSAPDFARVAPVAARRRGPRLAHDADALAVEGGQVVRFAAADPVAVADALLVFPDRAGVAHVVLQRRPARERAALDEAGGDQDPPAVADDHHRLPGAVDL